MAVHGKGTKLLMDGWLMHDITNSFENPATVDTAETTVFNSSGAKTYVTGVKDATLTAEGFFVSSSSDSSVEDTLHSALPTSGLNVWSYWPNGTSTAGNSGYGMTSIETGYTITSPVDGTIDISVDGQVSDGSDRIESLQLLSCAVTSTGQGTGLDGGAASTNGAIGYFQRVTNTTNAITVAIQDSNNNSTFANLISFSSVTSRAGERVAVAGTVKQYVREVHTTTGALGTGIQFSVGFKRKG